MTTGMPWPAARVIQLPMAWLTLLAVLAISAGLAVALGGGTAAVAIVALMLFLVSIVLPFDILLITMFALVFLVVGQLQYFARIEKAFWIPYLLGLLLHLRVLLFAMRGRSYSAGPPQMVGSMRLALWLFGLFMLTAAASSAVNTTAPLSLFLNGKEYFFLAAVLAAFAVGAVGLAEVDKLLRFLPWFVALQVPAVLYQRFVVATRRIGDSPWDAVVGLFGGDPNGGGASGTMGIFSLVAVVFALEAWKAGRFSGTRTLVTVACALAAVALAEVKLIILLLPLTCLIVFGQTIVKRPLLGIAGLLLGVVLAGSMLMLYQQQYASTRTQEGRSLLAYIESTFQRNSDERSVASTAGEMGRVATLRFWAQEQRWSDAATTLIGHGVGASRIGTLSVGDIVVRYHLQVGRSSLAIHLWEAGLLGALALASSLAIAALTAWRLARSPALADRAWQLRAAAVSLWLVLLTLPYGPDFVQVAQLQVLTFAMMGLVVAASRARIVRDRPI